MTTPNLIYHFCVIAMSILIFFMKFTSQNDFLELIIKTLGKIAPLFSIAYAIVQLFKHFKIIN